MTREQMLRLLRLHKSRIINTYSMSQSRIFFISAILFLTLWFAFGAYTFLAILNPNLQYSLRLFWTFLLILDAISIPVLWLWFSTSKNTIKNRTYIAVAAVIFVFYYGFATIHSFLSLLLNDLQLRWLGFIYIWEVVVVGALVAYFVGRITKFASDYLEGTLTAEDALDIHARIAFTPFKASVVYVILVLLAYGIGSTQLYFFSNLPLSELTKNLINGLVASILSSFAIFFLIERLVEPALKESGTKIYSGNQAIERKHSSSLFTKIYAISALLAIVSVGFFGTVAFGRTQVVLETEAVRRMADAMVLVSSRFETSGRLLSEEEETQLFGSRGTLYLLTRAKESENFYIPDTLGRLFPQGLESLHTNSRQNFIDRNHETKIIAMHPIDSTHSLVAVMYVSDFSKGLGEMISYSAWILLLIIAVVAIIGTFFARSIMWPIQQIKEGGVRIGKGEFREPISVYTNDELEEVSLALNEASTNLRDSYEKLEDEIKKRTKEIENVNQKQEEQIRLLDETSRRLVRRDLELQMANDRLREMDDAKSQFVSIAAHQLRTPLSAIKWTFSMLMSRDFGDMTLAQETAVKRASESVDRIISLVGDLLSVARIESGQIMFKFEPFRIDKLIQDVINQVKLKAEERHVTITFTRQKKKIPEIRGDAEKLNLVFQNILENAVNYTSTGGYVKIKLQILDDGYYEVSFMDNGVGIPKQQQGLLFQKFFRADNVIKLQKPGTGLGLYLAHKIVEVHKGMIKVESEEGKGSTFTIRLPFLT